MSIRDELTRALAKNGINGDGKDQAPFHSWRCEYPERYGPCQCLRELLEDLEAVVRKAIEVAGC